MDKNNFLIGIIGLLLGCIIGFLFANNLNQSAPQSIPTAQITSSANSQNSNLPPDHPPLNQPNVPQAQVMEALKNAEEQPNDFKAQLAAGDLHYQNQKYDEAAKFYERASKLRPDDFEALVKTADANFDAEHFEVAEKWYSSALAKNPNDPNVRTDYGLTFYLRKPPDIERAIKEYKISLEKDPNHELTLQNLIVALKDKGDTKSAQEAIDKLAKINPKNPVITK
jgi:tetratricopeptide (TPR) repeat protein